MESSEGGKMSNIGKRKRKEEIRMSGTSRGTIGEVKQQERRGKPQHHRQVIEGTKNVVKEVEFQKGYCLMVVLLFHCDRIASEGSSEVRKEEK